MRGRTSYIPIYFLTEANSKSERRTIEDDKMFGKESKAQHVNHIRKYTSITAEKQRKKTLRELCISLHTRAKKQLIITEDVLRGFGNPHQPGSPYKSRASRWKNTKFVVYAIHNLSVDDVQMRRRPDSSSSDRAIDIHPLIIRLCDQHASGEQNASAKGTSCGRKVGNAIVAISS